MELLAGSGYIGLFSSAFLAATLLPFGSEVLLTLMLAGKYDPVLVIATATFGNALGSLANYFIGIRGGHWLMKKILRLSEGQIKTAESHFLKYGNFVLLFAWLPVVGDPLTVVAGILKSDIWIFIVLVTFGKFIRYFIVAAAVLGVWS